MTENSEIEDPRVIARRVETEALAREMLEKRPYFWVDRMMLIPLVVLTFWTSYKLDWSIYALLLATSALGLQLRLSIDVAQLRRQVRALVALRLGRFDPQE